VNLTADSVAAVLNHNRDAYDGAHFSMTTDPDRD